MKKSILRIFAIALTTLLLACAMAFSVSAEDATAPAVSIDKFNLVFEDNVYLKYAVKYDGVNDESISSENIGMLFFSTPNGNYTAGNENFSSSVVGFVTIEGQKYYTFEYRYITAKQMTEYVYSVAYIDVDGVKYYSAPNKFSVLEYCYSKLGKTGEASTNEDYRNLLTATLEQGAMAQKYFKYNTDRLANADYYQVKLENGTLLDGTTSGLYLSGDKVVLTAPETDSKGHVFSRWENSKGSKIGTTAVYELTVGTENEIYTPFYEHNVVIDAAIAPTCTITGLTEGKHCSVCNKVLVTQTVVDALGHTEVVDKAVAPTCTETGLTEGKHCSVCDVVLVEQSEVKALGHTEAIDKAVAPTCTETGLTEGKHCTVCNTVFVVQTTVPATGHDYDAENTCTACGDYKDKGVLFTLKTDNTYSVSGYNGSATEVIIPSKYNGLPVTSIGDNAFDHTSVTNVVIPNSVKSIGKAAFINSALTSITIPDSVTNIENGTFYYCRNLQSVYLPSSIKSIGSSAFEGCALSGITIPDGVTNIEERAFAMSNLGYVAIPGSVTKIGNEAFLTSGCGSIKFDGTVEQWNAILKGNNLTYSVAEWTVRCLDGTVCATHLPVSAVENEIVADCTNNGSYDIVQYCEFCGEEISRKTVSIPAIGHSEVTDAAVAPNCTEIGLTEGKHCSVCGEVLVAQENIAALGHDYDSVVVDPTLTHDGYTVHTCAVCTESYTDSYVTPANFVVTSSNRAQIGYTGISGENLVIPPLFQYDGIWYRVTGIDGSAFYGCSNLEKVTISDGIRDIGRYAFCACINLKAVTIGKDVMNIGTSAFSGCTGLIEINYNAKFLNELTANVSNGVFSRAGIEGPGLTVNIGKDVYEIPSYLFSPSTDSSNAPRILKVNFAEGSACYRIGMYAFANCKYLTSVMLSSGIKSIAGSAFSGCSSLASIIIPDTVTGIGDNAFSYCTSLTIYCEVASKPSGWSSSWAPSDCDVIWGYKETN